MIIKSNDNVGIVLRDLKKGETVNILLNDKMITRVVKNKIPFGFKFVLRYISTGEHVLKSGKLIGETSTGIELVVHVHNFEGIRGRDDLNH